jgi:hypothetical protein
MSFLFPEYDISEDEFESLSPWLQNYIWYLEYLRDWTKFFFYLSFILMVFYYARTLIQ